MWLFRPLFHRSLLLHHDDVTRADQVLHRLVGLGQLGFGDSVSGHLKMRYHLMEAPATARESSTIAVSTAILRSCSQPAEPLLSTSYVTCANGQSYGESAVNGDRKLGLSRTVMSPTMMAHNITCSHFRHGLNQRNGHSCNRCLTPPFGLGASPRDRTAFHGSSGCEHSVDRHDLPCLLRTVHFIRCQAKSTRV